MSRRILRTRIRDPAILAAACRRLGLSQPRSANFFQDSGPADRRAVMIGEPPVPVVIDLETGTVTWQAMEETDEPLFLELYRLLQACACEAARREARRCGLIFQDQTLEDGSILIRLLPGKQSSSPNFIRKE